jgi:predicted DCC family thiol-disulfide oxidoreductase YuxK
MTSAPHLRVASPPPKPLMIWDGDCHFCRRWIERWREITAGRVDYESFQTAAAKFPEIPRHEFEKAVHFIETDGEVFRAAEAVYRSLGHNRYHRWPKWCYDRVPGFAAISETAYSFIARHRGFASASTRLFWGEDVRRPTYFAARRLFLRALGLIYLIAFISLWIQVDGLVGANGILPVRELMPAAKEQLGARAPFILPTLCWLDSSDAFLHFLCGAGTIVSVLLVAGFLPLFCLIALFVFYLSLTIAGQTFLSFQWDILLLEAGFLAIFFAPLTWRLRAKHEMPLSWTGLFLLQLLLFKLMFMSGVVKLTSGDDSWWNLSALDYHYWTQPLPTVLGWWGAQTSEWLKHFCTFAVLFVESLVPFLIWAPRRLRFLAFVLFVSVQIMIALTGNYCFFNLLTIALCFLLLDDTQIASRRRVVAAGADRGPVAALTERRTIARVGDRRSGLNLVAAFVLIGTLPVNAMLLISALRPEARWPRPIIALYSRIEPFRVVNGYGLFRVMTKERAEIVIEGSADGMDWLSYEFKWKPGDVKRAPGWVAPHQPRLDWQMWFAALGTYRQNPWFGRLVLQLLKNSPDVTRLLERNPFPNSPPRYIRAVLYDYHFTTMAGRRATGAWWKREDRGIYLPRVSLE